MTVALMSTLKERLKITNQSRQFNCVYSIECCHHFAHWNSAENNHRFFWYFQQKNPFEMNSLQLCRLCGRCDRHKIDILEHDFHGDDNSARKLYEIILSCVGIKVNQNSHSSWRMDDALLESITYYFQVTKDDKMTTKLCGNCLTKINYIIRFRELCAATDLQMRLLLGNSNSIGDSAIGSLDNVSAHEGALETADIVRNNQKTAPSKKRRRTNTDSCDSET